MSKVLRLLINQGRFAKLVIASNRIKFEYSSGTLANKEC